ncbi:MAG: NCS2 family permease [Oscillospiraceae bacterium]|nr:NCS2 family permease [Oscillospiraceae bacterium]
MEETKKKPYHPKGDFFDLKGNGTNVHTEIMAGLTTFFTMSYILFVNPQVLSKTGMDSQAVFLATIIAAAIGTLVMALFANVPYAQAPGMGLNAFFTYTVCMSLHFTWQQALAMVFICGLINITITVTKFRKMIIKSIPRSIQNAISGGIGIFVAYIGLKNANLIQFSTDSSSMTSINGKAYSAAATYSGITSVASNGGVVPSIATFNQPSVLVALFGIILIVVLLMLNVKGAILIGIVATTVIGIPFGVTDFSGASITISSLGTSFSKLGTTFGAAFSQQGMGSLFNDPSKFLLVIMTIFAFSLSDTFDTIGTFIGTGRRTGIFSEEDEAALENGKGFNSKMDRALFADSIATSIGAIFGTSNTTTFVESASGIGAGGRTGLTSLTTAIMFLLCTILAPVAGCIPAAATAPALIIVGVMMMSSFKEVNWPDLEEAIPAFGAGIFMALAYSISYGIAAGFIFYCIVKIVKGKFKEIHPILLVSAILFILNFIVLAVI